MEYNGLRKSVVLLCTLVVLPAILFGMPPHAGVTITAAQAAERARLGIDHAKTPVRDAGKQGIVNGPGHVAPLVTGTKAFPVVAIKFTDDSNQYAISDFQTMLFGSWSSGTAKDYYREASYGQFTPTGTVAGWYTAAHQRSYYGYNNGFARAAALVKEAAAAADASIDYSQYDNDGDGYVDAFTCLHVGFGMEESGDGNDIWSHEWDLNSAGVGEYTTNDPWPGHSGQYIKVNTYTCDPERSNYTNYGTMVCIGVFCHEWGHGLGLPDLYNTGSSAGEGLGNYSIMAGGSWGGDGNSPWSPVHLDPWCKMELGWLNPRAVRLRNLYGVPQVEDTAKDYWLMSRNRTYKEYWLVENREKVKFDQNLYASGLYIYHIDDSVIDSRRGNNGINANTAGWAYGVALEQADGADHLFAGTNRGDANDAWPGGLGKSLFDSSSTTPNSKTNYPTSSPQISGNLVKSIPSAGVTMACSLASGVQGAFTGGPDAGGYQWIDSDTTGGPAYGWNNITGTGTQLGSGDDARWSVSLPYTFSFYGTGYTTLWVCTNGWLSFGSDPGTNLATNTTIPNAAAPNAAIFPFWDDLNLVPTDSGYVYYQNFGTSPNCSTVVMWKNARIKNASSYNQATFEVVLKESGTIQVRYRDCSVSDTSYSWGRHAAVGIENSTGTAGLQYIYRGAPKGNLLSNVRTIQFAIPPVATDVQTVAILAPTGTVNQGTVTAPQATVKNNGSSSATFNVKFDISDGYSNTQTVTNLGAGATTTVTFGNWTASTAGTFTVKCSTRLTGDLNSANDKVTGSVTVQSLDAQTISIDVPTGTVNQGSVVAPRATVKNNGNTSQTFSVKYTITPAYADSQSVTLASGAQQQVTFANWTASTAGAQTTRCSTRLAGDMTPSNDKLTGSVFVQTLDAQTVSIDVPTGTVNQGTVIAPRATVKNNGNTSQTFSVRFTIAGGYADSQSVTLASGAQQQVTFANWTANPAGTLTVKCSTKLAGDQTPSNDAATGSVFVQGLDAQTISIDVPTGIVNLGWVVAPKATVKNNGNTSQTFYVKYTITPAYADSQSVTLASGAQQQVTFANWTASTAGTQTTMCSTKLAGDMTPSNDRLTGSVLVQSLDAQTVSIDAPTGTVNQGTIVAPKATVKNNGNTSQTFYVKYTITPAYADSQSVTLASGAQQQVTFANWTAIPTGTLTTKCSTKLAGDMTPSNDAATGSVLVQGLDVQTISIDVPTGTVNLGSVIAPKATVKNNGNTSQTFYVKYTITPAYADSQSVTLAAGARQQITFANWTASTAGTQTTKCSTKLAGDLTPANDRLTDSVFVQALDAQTISIDAPSGTVNEGALIAPQATLRNNGNTSQTFSAKLTITGGFADSQSVTLAAGAQQQVTFADWTAGPTGLQTVRCSTRLAGDMTPGNDALTGTVTVQLLDVGVIRLISPTGLVDSGVPVTPACSVYNFGNSAESFTVRMKIGVAYSQTAAVSNQAPGTTLYITFPAWTALPRGNVAVSCSTELTGDAFPNNDKITGGVTVNVHDLGAVAVISPTGLIPPGMITPGAGIHNYGTAREAALVTFSIDPAGYAQTESLPAGLPPGVDTTISFPDWTASPGAFTARCSTWTALEQVTYNDVTSDSFTVVTGDVGAVSILFPTGTLDTNTVIAPSAAIHNYGDLAATFNVHFEIGGAGAWSDSVAVSSLAPGATRTVTFTTWPNPHAAGDYTTRCSTALAADANPANDVQTGAFTLIGGITPGWTRRADVPFGGKGKTVKDGGRLTALDLPGGSDGSDPSGVYCFKGNNRCEFYEYSPLSNTWVTRESIPLIGRSGKKKAVKKGSTLIGANDKLYAAKGNNTTEWWRYDPALGTWQQMADVPLGAKALKEGTGSAAILLNDTTYVYLLKGSGTFEFYRYNTARDAWEAEAAAPAGTSGKPYRNGSALTAYPFLSPSLVFALKGNYNDFAAYDAGANAWTMRTALPLIGRSGRKKKVKDGAGIAAFSNAVWALKGNNTQEYWSYLVDSARWIQEEDMPLGNGKKVKAGGALAAADDRLYALKGNSTLEFWQYVPAVVYGSQLVAGGPDNAQSSIQNPKPKAQNLLISPNPFSSATTIQYSLPRAEYVNLKLYDLNGRLLSVLARGYRSAGISSFNVQRSSLSVGIYVLKLETCDTTTTSKLIIE